MDRQLSTAKIQQAQQLINASDAAEAGSMREAMSALHSLRDRLRSTW